jgi:hypothetical protein
MIDNEFFCAGRLQHEAMKSKWGSPDFVFPDDHHRRRQKIDTPRVDSTLSSHVTAGIQHEAMLVPSWPRIQRSHSASGRRMPLMISLLSCCASHEASLESASPSTIGSRVVASIAGPAPSTPLHLLYRIENMHPFPAVDRTACSRRSLAYQRAHLSQMRTQQHCESH